MPGTIVGVIPTRRGFTYRLNLDSLVFSLNQVSGEIRTKGRLDRERLGDKIDLIILSSSPTYPIEVNISVKIVTTPKGSGIYFFAIKLDQKLTTLNTPYR